MDRISRLADAVAQAERKYTWMHTIAERHGTMLTDEDRRHQTAAKAHQALVAVFAARQKLAEALSQPEKNRV